ncbi:MAG TPA: hypothetical protein VF446_14475 [Trinickia sp.]
MTDHQLDAVYTTMCRTLARLGEKGAPLFLARFALLALVELNDQAIALRLIEAAEQDLPVDATAP